MSIVARMNGLWRHHWSRPAGLCEVSRLALPLVVSTLSWTVMQFIDRVFLAWYSAEATAAALPAGALAFAVVAFPLGTASYVTTFVAQYHGAERPREIGPSVWQGIWLSVAAWPLVLLTIPLCRPVLAWAGHAPEILELEVVYYQVMCWGGGAMILSAALSAFYTGLGRTRTVMAVDMLAAALNVLLDWLWIFGLAGFPEAGIAGAAWATVVALWCKPVIYSALFLRSSERARFATAAGWRLDWHRFGRLLQFGSASGVQILLEVAGFTVFLLLVGRLGTTELAATSLAFNINLLAFMPVWGLGIATTTLVGQRLGKNEPDLAARATWSAFALSAALMGLVGYFYVAHPHWFLLAHEAGRSGSEANFDEVRELTIVLLRFVALYCLFDAMNVIFSSALKGAGDTQFILVTTVVMASVLAAASGWAVSSPRGGLLPAWGVVSVWIAVLGAIYCGRFVQGRWRTMRVIEPPAAAVCDEPRPGDERRETGATLPPCPTWAEEAG